uniref:SDR family NAD(P)-dependent oxidoreductase n=1 Tax=Sphingomonas sp. JE1 TaxID=1628059 RepID=UPI0011220077|nr:MULTISPECIES: glucose 1-dehydrogenase [unclassified Sphingomonas]
MPTGLNRLASKVAIVTGGANGIGGGVSRLFAAEGAAVIVADINPVTGRETVAEIEREGGRALFIQTDVASETDIIAMIDRAGSEYGGLDILVNNAGIGRSKTAEESDADDWDRVMTVNARSTFLATKYAIPRLRARGGGSIINIGSLFALRGAPTYALYATTKGAIRQFTKSAALAHAGEGIRINAVHPGIIRTSFADLDPDAVAVAEGNLGPSGRWGEPRDVAFACLFLASDEASFVTGIDMSVDGGLSA